MRYTEVKGNECEPRSLLERKMNVESGEGF